jgi:3-phenylpropionate/trans-cinnamate dioxygenase ferredoxin subunit
MESSKNFVRVASVGEVPPGEMKAVRAEGVDVLLCNVNGDVHAVHDECTHECFPLSEGTLDGHRLTCMLHGAQFDVRTGDVLALPAYGPVATYEVQRNGEDILVAVG